MTESAIFKTDDLALDDSLATFTGDKLRAVHASLNDSTKTLAGSYTSSLLLQV